MDLVLRKTDERAILPTRKNLHDAGLDLFALDTLFFSPWEQRVVDTGIEIVRMPMFGSFYSVMQIWPRSGMDSRLGIHTGAGIIDFSYRGNILVLVKNQSDQLTCVTYGTALAQAVILPVWTEGILVSEESGTGERGNTGGIVRGGSQGFIYSNQDQK